MSILTFAKSVTLREYLYARKHPDYAAEINHRSFGKYMELVARQRTINREARQQRKLAHNEKVDEHIEAFAEHGIHLLYYLFLLVVAVVAIFIFIAIL